MKTYIVPVHARNGNEEQTFELVLNAATAKRAAYVIECLIAHGHTISGLVGGVATDNCGDIEGNDGKADAASVYVIGTTNYEDIGDGELTIAGAATPCARVIFQRAKDLYLTA